MTCSAGYLPCEIGLDKQQKGRYCGFKLAEPFSEQLLLLEVLRKSAEVLPWRGELAVCLNPWLRFAHGEGTRKITFDDALQQRILASCRQSSLHEPERSSRTLPICVSCTFIWCGDFSSARIPTRKRCRQQSKLCSRHCRCRLRCDHLVEHCA